MRTAVRRTARRAASLAFAAALSAAVIGAPALAQEAAPAGPGLVAADAPVLLRDQPSYDAAALATLGQGDGVDVVGPAETAADGTAWLPVAAAGQTGYLPAGAVSSAGAAPAAEPESEWSSAPEEPPAPEAQTAFEAPPAPPDPSVEAPLADVLADPALAEAPADPAAPPPPAAAPVPAGAATTTSDVNLRSGPSGDAGVLMALPPGTSVSIDGAPVDGYAPVTANGVSGWVAAEFLAGASADAPDAPAAPAAAPPAPDPAPLPEPVASEAATSEATPVEDAPAEEAPAPAPASTGIAWPFNGGAWQVIQGYNNGTHTNRSGFAQYKYALDWARVDGDTAGQPVYAPVSGTIEWTDRGSGGLLMNAGNGYGVALFHITVDGGIARGGTVERGQKIGVVSGPGGDGYASTPHVDMTLWELSGGGHEATPFTGANAIGGHDFPDTGGGNQYMGYQVTP